MEAALFNVPARDDWARALLPEAHWTDIPFATAPPSDARVISVLVHDRVEPGRLARYPRLQAVVTRSDGTDHLPLDWMAEHGVRGYGLGGYATDSVAHLSILHLLALLRRVPQAAASTRRGSWDRSAFVGRHLDEVTVGILGVGRIGGTVARLLSSMGANVIGFDPATTGICVRAGSMAELARTSDALLVHVPLTEKTRRLIDEEVLALLRPGAVLVNTSRGDVVDQEAVLAALDAGRLSGYAADVLPGEPEPDLTRFARDDVLLTPHLGAHNIAAIKARYETTVRIIEAELAGHLADVALLRAC